MTYFHSTSFLENYVCWSSLELSFDSSWLQSNEPLSSVKNWGLSRLSFLFWSLRSSDSTKLYSGANQFLSILRSICSFHNLLDVSTDPGIICDYKLQTRPNPKAAPPSESTLKFFEISQTFIQVPLSRNSRVLALPLKMATFCSTFALTIGYSAFTCFSRQRKINFRSLCTFTLQ